MKKAISGCTAFYEKGYRADTAEDDFDISTEEDVPPCSAPDEETSHRITEIDAALDGDLDIDAAFSEAFMSNAVWAYDNDPARYAKIRQKLPKEVSLRDFTLQVKRRRDEQRASQSQERKTKSKRLFLRGIRTPGMMVPGNWIVDDMSPKAAP